MINFIIKNIDNISSVIIGIGAILLFFGLKITSSEIENNYQKGRFMKSALIEVKHTILIKLGSFLFVLGSIVQILIDIFKLKF